MAKNKGVDISHTPELVWIGPVFLLFALISLWLQEAGIFRLAFFMAALSSILVYTIQGPEIAGSRERNDWRLANTKFVHALGALVGWLLLYYLIVFRLDWVCHCTAYQTKEIGLLGFVPFRATDLVILLGAFWGVTGMLPRILSLEWVRK